MTSSRAPIKPWLEANGYGEILAMIEEIETAWKKAGKRTRRNWWQILAGDKYGKPRVAAGRTFPILAAAQVRQGLPVTENAIRSPDEVPPPSVWRTGRWHQDENGECPA